MPEGHTIHRLARRHKAMFAGHEVVATSPQGRFAEGAELLRVHDVAEVRQALTVTTAILG